MGKQNLKKLENVSKKILSFDFAKFIYNE